MILKSKKKRRLVKTINEILDLVFNEVEQDVKDSYRKIDSPFPSGIVFPHHKSLLLNGFVDDVAGNKYTNKRNLFIVIYSA